MPAVKEIFADATSGNMWTNRTLWQVSRMGVDRTTPGNIGHDCGISENSSPDLIGIIGTTDPPCGLNMILEIGNTRQSTSPNIRNPNKLDTSIGRQFTNNMVTPPIFTEILGDKPSDSSSQGLYTFCRMNLAEDPANILAPQFVDLSLSNINTLYKGASIRTPATRIWRPTDVSHGSALDYIFETLQSIETMWVHR